MWASIVPAESHSIRPAWPASVTTRRNTFSPAGDRQMFPPAHEKDTKAVVWHGAPKMESRAVGGKEAGRMDADGRAPDFTTFGSFAGSIRCNCNVMNNSALIAVGALLLGCAGGYLVGSSGKDKEEVFAESGLSSKNSRAGGRLSSGGGTPIGGRGGKSNVGNLNEILAEPGQTNRILSLLQYYADLDPSEFENEASKLQGLPMSQRMLAMNLLFARWAETDPHAALDASRSIGFPELMMARSGVLQGWAALQSGRSRQVLHREPGRLSHGWSGTARRW